MCPVCNFYCTISTRAANLVYGPYNSRDILQARIGFHGAETFKPCEWSEKRNLEKPKHQNEKQCCCNHLIPFTLYTVQPYKYNAESSVWFSSK